MSYANGAAAVVAMAIEQPGLGKPAFQNEPAKKGVSAIPAPDLAGPGPRPRSSGWRCKPASSVKASLFARKRDDGPDKAALIAVATSETERDQLPVVTLPYLCRL